MSLFGCFVLSIPPDKFLLTLASLSLAALAMLALRARLDTRLKMFLIYAHLTGLFFPIALFTTNAACGMACAPCYNDILMITAYALPSTLLLSTLAGFVVIPTSYVFWNRGRPIRRGSIFRATVRWSKKFGIKAPHIFVVDRAEPMAFSFRTFRSAIFFSVGLLDILNRREIEAVLLHEIAHIVRRASTLKFSFSILRVFSPLTILARFAHDSTSEERAADRFAARAQGTARFLNSTKKKLRAFS